MLDMYVTGKHVGIRNLFLKLNQIDTKYSNTGNPFYKGTKLWNKLPYDV